MSSLFPQFFPKFFQVLAKHSLSSKIIIVNGLEKKLTHQIENAEKSLKEACSGRLPTFGGTFPIEVRSFRDVCSVRVASYISFLIILVSDDHKDAEQFIASLHFATNAKAGPCLRSVHYALGTFGSGPKNTGTQSALRLQRYMARLGATRLWEPCCILDESENSQNIFQKWLTRVAVCLNWHFANGTHLDLILKARLPASNFSSACTVMEEGCCGTDSDFQNSYFSDDSDQEEECNTGCGGSAANDMDVEDVVKEIDYVQLNNDVGSSSSNLITSMQQQWEDPNIWHPSPLSRRSAIRSAVPANNNNNTDRAAAAAVAVVDSLSKYPSSSNSSKSRAVRATVDKTKKSGSVNGGVAAATTSTNRRRSSRQKTTPTPTIGSSPSEDALQRSAEAECSTAVANELESCATASTTASPSISIRTNLDTGKCSVGGSGTTKTPKHRKSGTPAAPEMITDKLAASLSRQGYRLVGSHSAVKMCRWTKHHIRGRGGCYKHTFYGISSMKCMEATPSLACANKCTFCWRHHSNPVGTSWKWKTDDPKEIVKASLDAHLKMINTLKGVPGVTPLRFRLANQPEHCALSLVGEPILYPYINELIDELHRRRISSFLVTNAQFPEQLRTLHRCTQLYLSVDAGTRESLKAIDRPLFSDFWERLLECLDLLRERKERTVLRLTLVKGQNMAEDEIDGYAQLIARGSPDFVEIKAVTYAGTSSSGSKPVDMSSVPWQEEVLDFVDKILLRKELSEEYLISCEHRHSCSILLAKPKFKDGDTWTTWIDYNRFFELWNHERNGADNITVGKSQSTTTPPCSSSSLSPPDAAVFTATDYVRQTPSWAVWGAPERGFDPLDKRVYTKGSRKTDIQRLGG